MAAENSRRDVHYDNYDELLSDVEQLAAGPTRTVGNWSFGQILDHLAKSGTTMIDGGNFLAPAPVRFLMGLLMKKKFTTKSLPSGFKIPKAATDILPEEVSVEEGLNRFRQAISRAATESRRGLHPVLGRLSKHEWDMFMLRHSELHMSFVHPIQSTT
ncbi:MAG: DUF1569 domain-containing protein [Pirellulales bacterium]|nr:DUF1569 domain-containing protein [Pirellulales bacterium]